MNIIRKQKRALKLWEEHKTSDTTGQSRARSVKTKNSQEQDQLVRSVKSEISQDQDKSRSKPVKSKTSQEQDQSRARPVKSKTNEDPDSQEQDQSRAISVKIKTKTSQDKNQSRTRPINSKASQEQDESVRCPLQLIRSHSHLTNTFHGFIESNSFAINNINAFLGNEKKRKTDNQPPETTIQQTTRDNQNN